VQGSVEVRHWNPDEPFMDFLLARGILLINMAIFIYISVNDEFVSRADR
jgi:hypothetical protein